MKTLIKQSLVGLVGAGAVLASTFAQAADSVNVAFFSWNGQHQTKLPKLTRLMTRQWALM